MNTLPNPWGRLKVQTVAGAAANTNITLSSVPTEGAPEGAPVETDDLIYEVLNLGAAGVNLRDKASITTQNRLQLTVDTTNMALRVVTGPPD